MPPKQGNISSIRPIPYISKDSQRKYPHLYRALTFTPFTGVNIAHSCFPPRTLHDAPAGERGRVGRVRKEAVKKIAAYTGRARVVEI